MVLHDHSATMSYPSAPPIEVVQAEAVVHQNGNLDDIFGSEPSSPTHETYENREANTEWSDIPRLREKHEKEGYRDGAVEGKSQTVQAGFDEGYSLGAVLGLRIGKILGLLEGILAAVRSGAAATPVDARDSLKERWSVEKQKLESLMVQAREELKIQSIFGTEWWGKDGVWKFEIPGEKEGKEVLFPDVASAHPLVKKWDDVVEKEISRWNIDLEALNHEQMEGETVKDDTNFTKGGAISTAPGAAKELSW